MAASKTTFDTIREMVSSGNIDQSSVDLLILSGMTDIKDELNNLKTDINKNFVRRDEDKEEEQKELNDKTKKMWPIVNLQIWAYAIFFGAIIAALATNKISITLIP